MAALKDCSVQGGISDSASNVICAHRLAHERDEEWSLRHAFLAAHQDKFQRNRLLCLASCFINVECYGCRYSQPVTQLLAELTVGLKELAKHRSNTHDRIANSIKFVPSHKSSSSDSTRQVSQCSSTASMKFVSASKSNPDKETAQKRFAPV